MQLQQALQKSSHHLKHLESPSLEAQVLLASLLQVDRTYLKTHAKEKLSWWQWWRFSIWVHRRAIHEPLAYIVGFKVWNDLKIFVNKQVLIPRDETEILCQHIQENLEIGNSTASILDLGTGSGCIAIWFKKKFPNTNLTASDISKGALKIAKKNAKHHKTPINFVYSDMFEVFPSGTRFDLIVANLPYVPETLTVSAEVQQEPIRAIFSGDDGLNHIRQFAQELQDKKISFSQCWLEFLPQQEQAIREIFPDEQIEFHKDLGGQTFFACLRR